MQDSLGAVIRISRILRKLIEFGDAAIFRTDAHLFLWIHLVDSWASKSSVFVYYIDARIETSQLGNFFSSALRWRSQYPWLTGRQDAPTLFSFFSLKLLLRDNSTSSGRCKAHSVCNLLYTLFRAPQYTLSTSDSCVCVVPMVPKEHEALKSCRCNLNLSLLAPTRDAVKMHQRFIVQKQFSPLLAHLKDQLIIGPY